MPFSNPIVGGENLVIPGIQSPNFVSGVSGWRIARDGTVELNNGTFRGSLEAGSLTGQHFWVNNPATGDVIDVYDSTNTLILKVTGGGGLYAINPGTGDAALVFGNGFLFEQPSSPPASFGGMTGVSNATASHVTIDSGRITGGASSNLALWDNINAPDGHATVFISQRGAAAGAGNVQGSVVQTDFFSSKNQLVHMDSYSGTTDASGFLFPAHNCKFTPTGCVIVGSTSGGTFANLTWGVNGFSSTIMSVNFHVANTGAAYANQAISFYAIFWG